LLFGLLFVPAQGWGQQYSDHSDFLHFNNPYVVPTESNPASTGLISAVPAGGASLPTGSSAISSNADLEVTWRTLPKKFLLDQKDMWLFPGELAKGRHWLPTILLVGGTAVLITQDPTMERAVRKSGAFGTFNGVLSSAHTDAIMAGVPAAWYIGSLLTKNKYGQSTALLAGEAVANDAVFFNSNRILPALPETQVGAHSGVYSGFGHYFFADYDGIAFPVRCVPWCGLRIRGCAI